MPDNVRLGLEQQNRNKHSTMATFDNPSYFTVSGQSPVSTSTAPADGFESIGAKPKRFKSWFKLPKRRPKLTLNDPENNDKFSGITTPPDSPEPEPQSNFTDFAHSEVVYYNFCSASAPVPPSGEVVNDDDVFSDSSTVRDVGSTRNLSRRRHSIGSWFRSSLAAVRKHNVGLSTASGLESQDTVTERTTARPSTSSERALLPRNVSSSANCVSSTSTRDVRTPERGRTGETKATKRSRLPVAVKSHVELRARARYARQEKLVRDSKAVSTSRIPRAIQSPHHHRHQTASLDRRYTKSTEVLASDVASSSTHQQNAVATVPEQLEAEDSFQQREDSCSARRKSISSTTSRQRFVQRSRTIEDRHRTSCCGRMAAAAAASTSCRSERRRASFDAASPSSSSSHTRRRCQRCRDKVEPTEAEKVDVVIIFSKNCVVAYQWISYLTEALNKIFASNDRPTTRVTSRDVESLVDSSTLPVVGHAQPPPTPPDSRFKRTEYQNVSASGKLDAERSVRQHSVRKTVATASLQIVLLSKPLLCYVGLHANDPLGTLLNPRRVLGLLLGVDESKDIMDIHRSALYSFEYWPKVIMLDQDVESVNRFWTLAQSILNRSQPPIPVEDHSLPRFKLTPKKLRSGDERVTLILLQTVENIQSLASVHVGVDLVLNPLRIEKLSWINPYVVTFNVPKPFLDRTLILKVQLKVNNVSWGIRELKCQSKLGEIAILLSKCQLMGSPMDIMCQALNISPADYQALDKVLAQSIDKTKFCVTDLHVANPADEPREDEFPTLIHFAARYGLKEVMWAAFECLGAVNALQVRNFSGVTALQLAEMHGHHDIVNSLKTFTQVVEGDKKNLTPQHKKSIQLNAVQADIEPEDDYVGMKPHSDFDHPKHDYDKLPQPKPIHPSFCSPGISSDEDPYMVLVSNTSPFVNQAETPKDENNIEERSNVEGDDKSYDAKNAGQHTRIHRKENVLSLARRGIPVRLLKEEAAQRDAKSNLNDVTLEPLAVSIEPSTALPSRGSSPLSNWSSSDRSSVTSQLSHDSGTHFESSEEKKASPNIRSDYDVPPSTFTQITKSIYYDVPPPPKPIETQSTIKNHDAEGYTAFCQVAKSLSQTSISPPRPPTVFRNPFETIECNQPTTQGILGENLSLIVSCEEPVLMQQPPILLSKSPPKVSSLQTNDKEMIYIEMSPSFPRKYQPSATNLNTIADTYDNYVKAEDLNMPNAMKPTSFRERNLKSNESKSSLEVSKVMSSSDIQLPLHNQKLVSEWRSDPYLSKPVVTPRKRVPPTALDILTPPLPPRNQKTDLICQPIERKT